MNESYRLGEQLIIAYLQRLANGISTAELYVAALPAELRAVGEQLQKTHAPFIGFIEINALAFWNSITSCTLILLFLLISQMIRRTNFRSVIHLLGTQLHLHERTGAVIINCDM